MRGRAESWKLLRGLNIIYCLIIKNPSRKYVSYFVAFLERRSAKIDLMKSVLTGFLTGLSVGVYCLGICLPVFVPLLLSKTRKTKESFWLILEFSLGRLLGYLLFGFLVGYLGVVIKSNLIHQMTRFSTAAMGFLMLGYCLGLTSFWGHKTCKVFFHKVKIPFLLGFLTGLNVCPPFLASLGYVFNLKSAILGMFYFLFFFLGTSLYIVPLALLGIFSQQTFFRKIARISGILVGGYFLTSGLNLL